MITIVNCTARREPKFDWLADSIVHALDFCAEPAEFICVDKLIWSDPKPRREQLADAIRGRFSYRHVAPKPSPWQGPYRKTKSDYYDLCGARNTGIALARGRHVILVDDCTLVDELWLQGHARAAARGICLAGSFRSYNTAKVENGRVVEGELHPMGVDSRGEETKKCSGSWLFGLNCSFPVEGALKINGYDEKFSGQGGSEDCLNFGAEILTDRGLQRLGSLVGQQIKVLTTNRKWVPATVQQFSKQRLYRVTCRNRRGHVKEIYCTANHKWFVKGASKATRTVHVVTTNDLVPGQHRFAYTLANSALKTKTVPSPFGIAHGIAFGDGCREKTRKASAKVSLYGAKRELAQFFSGCTSHLTKCEGATYNGLPNYFKELPSLEENTAYLLGWVMGYFAADGSVSKLGAATFASCNYRHIAFFRDICLLLGIECYPIRTSVRDTNFKKNSTLYAVSLGTHTLTKDFFLRTQHRERFRGKRYTESMTTRMSEWDITTVDLTDQVEDTYCAVVPGTHAFVLEGGILTHNCATGIRLEKAEYPIVYMGSCRIYQILETHEPVCEFAGWGTPQPRKQKELLLADGRMHFANEFLIQEWLRKPQIEPYGNDFDLRELRRNALQYGTFPTERSLTQDWRDGELLECMG